MGLLGADRDFGPCLAVANRVMDGVLIGSADGRVFYANRAACEMLAASEAELCGVGWRGICEVEDPAWTGVLRGRTPRATVLMSRLDGTRMIGEVAPTIFGSLDGEEYVWLTVRDVTLHAREIRRLTATDELTRAVLAGNPPAEIDDLALRLACQIFDAACAAIAALSRDGQGVLVMAAHGEPLYSLVGATLPSPGDPNTIMSSGQPALTEDFHSLIVMSDTCRIDLGPGMVVPVASDGMAPAILYVGARGGSPSYTRDDLEVAVRYTDRLGKSIALGLARHEAEMQRRLAAEHLLRALDSRAVIEQAKGFVASQFAITPEQAFDRIRRYSRSHSKKLHDIAQAVVDRRLIP
jgi:hypothetical protein